MPAVLYDSPAAAVADIPDGASLLIPGFGPGTPWNLLRALYKQGTSNLFTISNAVGGRSPREDVVVVGDLVASGRVRKVIASFTAPTHPSRPSESAQLIAAGEVEAEVIPQGTLAERIRAGGAGIPAFYTPAGVGTEVAAGRETREFDGRHYLLERAITADYAFVRAWKADAAGNLIFRLAARNYNPIMAMAADCTIVEVEQPIVPAGELDPNQIHTPSVYVQRLAPIPSDGLFAVNAQELMIPPPPRTQRDGGRRD
jgi:3-oxoacid CoA-transferase A subunit